MCALSHVPLFETPWTVVLKASLSMASPGQNTGVGYHTLLQGIFLTRGLNPCLLCLLHCRWILYHCTTWELCWKSIATCLTSRLPDTVYVGELIEPTSLSWGTKWASATQVFFSSSFRWDTYSGSPLPSSKLTSYSLPTSLPSGLI